MYLEYNFNVDCFSLEELRHLAAAMGFPKTVFEDNLPSELVDYNNNVLIRDLMKCIDDRCFNIDLHFTINLKSATYNTASLKQAIKFISRRFLSFKQLQEVRLAFETYENYDQKGMKIDEYVFLRTLKMCGRVISPKKLMHKVKHLRLFYKEPGRIQFFEFLNLLALCELTESQSLLDNLHLPTDKTWTKLYKVDNFKHFTIPKDKKLWKHLNKEYKEKELNYSQPILISSNFLKYPLQADDFRTQVRLSNKQYDTLHRSLKNSSKQVKLAKGGFTYVRPQTAQTSRESKGKSTVSAGSKNMSLGKPSKDSARALTPATVTTKDAVQSNYLNKTKRRHRPQSSPPVMSDRLIKDSKDKLENVQFDMCTEKQRWSEYYQSNMSSVLPNYHEVLQRMKKPASAPRRRRTFKRERPSPVIIQRLSSHEANLPSEHIEHCDALTKGVGMDQHSISLKTKAKKIRCKSAPVTSTKPIDRSTERANFKPEYSSLLRSLMEEYGYISDDDSSTLSEIESCDTIPEENIDSEDQVFTLVENEEQYNQEDESASEYCASSNEDETESMQPSESDTERKQLFMEEYYKSRNERKLNIHKHLVDSGYFQTFIKTDENKSSIQRVRSNVNSSPTVSQEDIASDQTMNVHELQPRKLSDFEKHILDPENLRIPHDVCLIEDGLDYYERKRRQRSLRRIAQRYEGSDKKWFKSSLKRNLFHRTTTTCHF